MLKHLTDWQIVGAAFLTKATIDTTGRRRTGGFISGLGIILQVVSQMIAFRHQCCGNSDPYRTRRTVSATAAEIATQFLANGIDFVQFQL